MSSRVDRLTREKNQLAQQEENLKSRNSELESLYSKLSDKYMTAQSLISHKSTLAQDLEAEVTKLTHSVSQVQLDPSQPDTSDQIRRELAELKIELEKKDLLVSKLEQEKEELKIHTTSPSLEQSRMGTSRTTTRLPKRLETRLEEAMKNVQLHKQVFSLS